MFYLFIFRGTLWSLRYECCLLSICKVRLEPTCVDSEMFPEVWTFWITPDMNYVFIFLVMIFT